MTGQLFSESPDTVNSNMRKLPIGRPNASDSAHNNGGSQSATNLEQDDLMPHVLERANEAEKWKLGSESSKRTFSERNDNGTEKDSTTDHKQSRISSLSKTESFNFPDDSKARSSAPLREPASSANRKSNIDLLAPETKPVTPKKSPKASATAGNGVDKETEKPQSENNKAKKESSLSNTQEHSSARQFSFLSAASTPNVATPPTESNSLAPAMRQSSRAPISATSSIPSSGASTPVNKHPWVFHGCSKVNQKYRMLDKLGEGTFGEVHKGEKLSSGLKVALKRIFLHNEKEGFPITALREIRILKNLDHPNIIPIIDMAVQQGDRTKRQRGSVYMVTPYMEHDLAGLLGNPSVHLELPHIKCYMRQLLEGVKYLHDQRYLHRDIKSANILIDNSGNLRIADFGLARSYHGDPPVRGSGAGKGKQSYTGMVVTRWYRAPELVLGQQMYTTAVDMWGVGCVFAEMFRREPILRGTSDSDQAVCIFKLLGSPTQANMPGFDELPGGNVKYSYRRTLEEKFKDLDPPSLLMLSGLLMLDPLKRTTAIDALDHSFFRTIPKPCSLQDLPQYNDSHELDARKSTKEKNRQAQKPPYHQEQYSNFSPVHHNQHHNDHHYNQPYQQNNNMHRPMPPYRNHDSYHDYDNSPQRPQPSYKDNRRGKPMRPLPPYKQQAPLPYDSTGAPQRPVPPYRQQQQAPPPQQPHQLPYDGGNNYQRPLYNQHSSAPYERPYKQQQPPPMLNYDRPPQPPYRQGDRPAPPYRSQPHDGLDSDLRGPGSRGYSSGNDSNHGRGPPYREQGSINARQAQPPMPSYQAPSPPKSRKQSFNGHYSDGGGEEGVGFSAGAPHLPPKPRVDSVGRRSRPGSHNDGEKRPGLGKLPDGDYDD